MKFTAQEEYGLRCVLHLARERDSRPGGAADDADSSPVSIAEIAAVEGVSEQYVGKLFRILQRGGLVESVRGRNGGSRLSRPAEEISVAEVLEALGGVLYEPGTCERYRGNKASCVHATDCTIRSLWSGLQALIDRVLARTTLRDLVGSELEIGAWIARHLEALDAVARDDVTRVDAPEGERGPRALHEVEVLRAPRGG